MDHVEHNNEKEFEQEEKLLGLEKRNKENYVAKWRAREIIRTDKYINNMKFIVY